MSAKLAKIVATTKSDRLAKGFLFTEGPLWHPDDYLLFADIRKNVVFKLVPGNEPEVVRASSGGTNGMTFDLDGRLVMCEGDNRRMTRMGPDGAITTIAEKWNGKRLNRPNDVVVSTDGTIYFTNPGGRVKPAEREILISGVHTISTSGTVSLAGAEFEYPNGLAFSPDETLLYVSNTRPSMDIRVFDVRPDGSLKNGRVFADMSSSDNDGVPDGMKVDVEGRVYCAGPGGCWVFEPSGEHLGTIRLPEVPANCAWGGPDNRTMYFTARTSIYSLRMHTPGMSVR